MVIQQLKNTLTQQVEARSKKHKKKLQKLIDKGMKEEESIKVLKEQGKLER
jgi:hypothetical protein